MNTASRMRMLRGGWLFLLGLAWIPCSANAQEAAPRHLTLSPQDFPVARFAEPSPEGWHLERGGELRGALRVDTGTRIQCVLRIRRAGEGTDPLPVAVWIGDEEVCRGRARHAQDRTLTCAVRLSSGTYSIRVRHVAEVPAQTGQLVVESVTLVAADRRVIPTFLNAAAYQDFRLQRTEAERRRAETSLDTVRRGTLPVQVVNPQGLPIPDAEVKLTQVSRPFQFGTALQPALFEEGVEGAVKESYLETVTRLFNAVTVGPALQWTVMQPTSGERNNQVPERMLAWCTEQGFPLRGQEIYSSCADQVPAWVQDLDDTGLRAAVDARARYVGRLFRGKIPVYDLVRDQVACDYFSSRLGTGVRRQMFFAFQAVDSGAMLCLDEDEVLSGRYLEACEELVRQCLREDVPLGGIGLRATLSADMDPVDLRRALDRLAGFGRPLWITGLRCPVEDEDLQRSLLEDAYRVAFAHPMVTGIFLDGFWEGAHPEPAAALIRRDFTTKPAGQMYEQLVLDTWSTEVTGRTDPEGRFEAQAFFGEYLAQVDAVGYKPFKQQVSWYPSTGEAEWVLTLHPGPGPDPFEPMTLTPPKPAPRAESPPEPTPEPKPEPDPDPKLEPVEDIFAPVGL